jgi:hypothetical protein
MSEYDFRGRQRPNGLLDYLQQRGWKPTLDRGREELAGLCPLHRESQPSFYVNPRKQVFYCMGVDAVAASPSFDTGWKVWDPRRTTQPSCWKLLTAFSSDSCSVARKLAPICGSVASMIAK